MSSAVTDESPAPAKGLSSGSLGLWGNTVIGLASTAPAYSLAATLGYVVLAVGEKSPAMFLIAFVPMLLTAIAYRELNSVMPDCGTTFTWGAKALGPWVGWLGGWGVAVSGIIVLANVAEVAAVYFLRAFGLDEVAENRIAVLLLGVGFIAAMTWVSYRGIIVSERLQNVLVVFQFIVLGGLSILALWKVYAGTAGPQAVLPEWSWFNPAGLTSSAIAAAVILCLFIYWGWDACLAVNEETKDLARTPGRAAVLATVILLVTYCLVAVAVQAYAGFGTTGIGLNNEANIDDVVTVLGGPHARPGDGVHPAAGHRGVRHGVDPDHHPADRPRHPRDGHLQGGARAVRARAPRVQDALVLDDRHGRHRRRLLHRAQAAQRGRPVRLDRVAGPRRGVLLRRDRVGLRRVLLAVHLPQRPQLLPARPVPACSASSGCSGRSASPPATCSTPTTGTRASAASAACSSSASACWRSACR